MAMTWKGAVQRVENVVENTIDRGAHAVYDLYSTIAKTTIDTVQSIAENGNSVVGIDTAQIPTMQEKIRAYVNGVNNALAELKNYNPNVAFKGTGIEEALSGYIDAMIEVCGAVTSYMLAFNDKLTAVQKAYEAKDTSSADTIKASAASAKSQFEKYTEQGAGVGAPGA